MLAALAVLTLLGPTLDQKIAEILPTKEDEKWLSIPWRTDITQARLDAQKESKPIFMWIMNGHPMGCT
jgi:hypothetical protein